MNSMFFLVHIAFALELLTIIFSGFLLLKAYEMGSKTLPSVLKIIAAIILVIGSLSFICTGIKAFKMYTLSEQNQWENPAGITDQFAPNQNLQKDFRPRRPGPRGGGGGGGRRQFQEQQNPPYTQPEGNEGSQEGEQGAF